MQQFKEFFWFCAGINRSLIKRCPTDTAKYTGIGAAVFFTGLLAALSGGYAVFTVFESVGWAIGFGLLWGLIIFNLDRFIVSTMRKQKKAFARELLTASPRILLAIMLAIVISKPLELKIFSKEIDRKLVTLEEEIYQKEIIDLEQRYTGQLLSIEAQSNQLKDEIKTKTEKRDALALAAQQEADGTGGSGKRNAGPIYQIKKADADQAQSELAALNQNYQPLILQKQAEWNTLFDQKQTEIANLKRNPWNGMAAQLQALSILGQENEAIRIANIFILLLFILLECTPIISKLISGRGPYDELLEIREHYFKNHNLERIAEMDHSTYKKIRENYAMDIS
ncbi:MAG: hypothetical protein COW03_17625 [Cytophagales bacterium CG12_big_fil_rev_8_21_14_0_65_40_12]|nr:MAG: hypothetical protein COW03_17625 [Cytophagales bacterium CG12_big_fil_rev_8_21_14_0_65_40_12]PIW06148.1 MAG: DUF4407 domain-containing protein [Cytophagales bacterium CG17_big_fil_post_rev_8_21_14_2_50_40_13]